MSFQRYLPSRFGHLAKVREAVLDPRVNLLERHPPAPVAVNSKLDQRHVGVRRPLHRWRFNLVCTFRLRG